MKKKKDHKRMIEDLESLKAAFENESGAFPMCLEYAIEKLKNADDTNKYNIPKGTLKARTGNFVIYDVDYLLDNIVREIYLLESVRRMCNEIKDDKDKERENERDTDK